MRRTAILVAVLGLAVRLEAGAPDGPPLPDLLAKVGDYCARYEQEFSSIAAEELYLQKVFQHRNMHINAQRTIKSDILFAQLGGDLRWATFRDAYEVDGKPIRERQSRLEMLFRSPSQDAYAKAQELLAESARYNVGAVGRNFNLPTLVLVFLHPENQARFKFKRKGKQKVDGAVGWGIEYEEHTRPMFIQDGNGKDLLTHGQIWADDDGRILRTLFKVEDVYGENKVEITVDFGQWQEDAVLVPKTMREMYWYTPAANASASSALGLRENAVVGATDTGEYVEAVATYSAYHIVGGPTE
jgi:hypothetical protein